MENMSSLEILFYTIMLGADCVLAWQWAKNGFLEIGIQRPPNTAVLNAAFIGILTMVIAGFAERYGYVKMSLFTHDSYLKAGLIFTGFPLMLVFLIRVLILPKGLVDYNKARIRMVYWSIKYYRPGIKLEEAEELDNFSLANGALDLFEKSIVAQKKGVSRGPIVNVVNIDYEKVDYDKNLNATCPHCGLPIKVPIYTDQGEGGCACCSCRLTFRIINQQVYITALGSAIRRIVSPRQKLNIATAHEEKALLLRMMNRFEDAKKSLFLAEKIIDELLQGDDKNKEYLRTKGLITFRKGEIAQVTGNKSQAKLLYQESLEIDRLTGDTYSGDYKLTQRLLGEVS